MTGVQTCALPIWQAVPVALKKIQRQRGASRGVHHKISLQVLGGTSALLDPDSADTTSIRRRDDLPDRTSSPRHDATVTFDELAYDVLEQWTRHRVAPPTKIGLWKRVIPDLLQP